MARMARAAILNYLHHITQLATAACINDVRVEWR